MKSEDERKWFDFHGIQPELAELYRYFDRTVLCYRIIIASGLIKGENPRKLARHLTKRFGVSAYNAERLMVTELARVQTEAQKQSFIRNGFDEYVYVACTKGDVCPICKGLDDKHFKVDDMMPGENAPPMHPNCHCSTAAYMDKEILKKKRTDMIRAMQHMR